MAERETIIGAGIRISGEIRGDEDLLVRGRVDGKIQLTQKLTVEEGAVVEADVDVRALVVAGTVVGNIVAAESVKLLSSARVVGNLASPRVAMEAGAAYRGRVDMGDMDAVRPVVASRPASRPVAHPSEIAQRATPAPARAAIPAKAAPTPARVVPKLSAPAKSSTAAPPTLPRVAGVASSAAPSWAKKKIKRR